MKVELVFTDIAVEHLRIMLAALHETGDQDEDRRALVGVTGPELWRATTPRLLVRDAAYVLSAVEHIGQR